LIAAAVAGDRGATEQLLVAHHDRLVGTLRQRLARHRRSPLIDLDDVIQQTYCDVFRTIGTFRDAGGATDGFFRWLLAVATHRLADMRRRARAQRRGGVGRDGSARSAEEMTLEQVVEYLVTASRTSPSRVAARHEVEQQILAELSRLPDDYRRAIQLRYLRGLPVAQVAAKLGRSERAVHMLCNRGLKQLRKALGGSSGAFLSAGA
jgi:RNA polymerase sigma-70 factor (ECF subfamily)